MNKCLSYFIHWRIKYDFICYPIRLSMYENRKIYIWYAYLFNFCFKAPLFSVACDVWICGGGASSESICETFCIIYTTRELISRDLAKGRVVGAAALKASVKHIKSSWPLTDLIRSSVPLHIARLAALDCWNPFAGHSSRSCRIKAGSNWKGISSKCVLINVATFVA